VFKENILAPVLTTKERQDHTDIRHFLVSHAIENINLTQKQAEENADEIIYSLTNPQTSPENQRLVRDLLNELKQELVAKLKILEVVNDN
jgi:hypothetical protein